MGREQKNVSKCQPLQRPAGLSSNCHHREADGSKILPCGGFVSHAFHRQKDVWNRKKGWTLVNEKKDSIQQEQTKPWQKTYERVFSFITLFAANLYLPFTNPPGCVCVAAPQPFFESCFTATFSGGTAPLHHHLPALDWNRLNEHNDSLIR